LDLYLLIRVFGASRYLHKQVGLRPKHLIFACSLVCILAMMWRDFPVNVIVVAFLAIRAQVILAVRKVNEMRGLYWSEFAAPWRIAYLVITAALLPLWVWEMDPIMPMMILESYLMDCPEDPTIGQSKLGQWFGRVKDKMTAAMDNAAPQPA